MDKETQTEGLWNSSQPVTYKPINSAKLDDDKTELEPSPNSCNSKATQTEDSKATQTEDSYFSAEDEQTKRVLKEVGLFVVKAGLISGAVVGGVALAVPAMGFTAGGVAAGSLAAVYQSTFLGGTIASGSAFAVLQSVGAAGLAASTNAALVGVSVVAAGIQTFFSRGINSKERKPEDKK